MNGIKIDIIDQKGVWKTYKSNTIPRVGELVYVEDKIKCNVIKDKETGVHYIGFGDNNGKGIILIANNIQY